MRVSFIWVKVDNASIRDYGGSAGEHFSSGASFLTVISCPVAISFWGFIDIDITVGLSPRYALDDTRAHLRQT